MSFILI